MCSENNNVRKKHFISIPSLILTANGAKSHQVNVLSAHSLCVFVCVLIGFGIWTSLFLLRTSLREFWLESSQLIEILDGFLH